MIKIYKLKEFIRMTETGTLDIERSKQLIRQLAAAAAFRGDDNILLDFRDTMLASATMSDILEVACEFARYESAFQGKIANVIPDDENRISVAKRFKAALNIDPHRYEIFTSFEEAIDWLSEIGH